MRCAAARAPCEVDLHFGNPSSLSTLPAVMCMADPVPMDAERSSPSSLENIAGYLNKAVHLRDSEVTATATHPGSASAAELNIQHNDISHSTICLRDSQVALTGTHPSSASSPESGINLQFAFALINYVEAHLDALVNFEDTLALITDDQV
ncbi:hypothetical protein DACRYDRAFT_109860 [Dacryopinax primogenitus]|uniref:Uncharacterized protein n=1 Tax=Dacryopinax primogenitus (strain DJM 731) TaxID=1858805 RepID=M5G1M4_DACPD|nr:uncharacterized protein DACRYDRAFT_109860 [Dacryopinax primogenitus]EJT99756.1 hypothetical protein DACRYDRAFT_109860 [Dacryopinax primogenitus]